MLFLRFRHTLAARSLRLWTVGSTLARLRSLGTLLGTLRTALRALRTLLGTLGARLGARRTLLGTLRAALRTLRTALGGFHRLTVLGVVLKLITVIELLTASLTYKSIRVLCHTLSFQATWR